MGEHDFVYVHTDIPEGMTIREWRAARARRIAEACDAERRGRRENTRARLVRAARRVAGVLAARPTIPASPVTDHHPQPAGPAPTARQQRYLRQLAMRRGISFVPPRTCFEASHLIDQLRRRRPDTVADRRREIRAVQDDTARDRGDAARVVEGRDTVGYGSKCRWSH